MLRPLWSIVATPRTVSPTTVEETWLSLIHIYLGEGRGRLYVYLGNKPHERVAHAFGENIPDHKILSATLHILSLIHI